MIELNSLNNFDAVEFAKQLEDDSVDLCLYSPPYDGVRSYKGGWTLDLPSLGKETFRSLKDGGVCVVVIGDGTKDGKKSLTTARLIIDFCDNAGFSLFEHCIYARHGNPGNWWSKRFRVDHESILIFYKGDKIRHFDKEPLKVASKHAGKVYSGTDRQTDGTMRPITPKAVNATKCRGTIWKYASSNSEGNKVKNQHPAAYPVKLAEDIIQCFSKENDVVVDPFGGSGTTGIAAKNLNRNYILNDISLEYIEIQKLLLKS